MTQQLKRSWSVAMLTITAVTALLDQILDSVIVRGITTAALLAYITVEWRETTRTGKFMLATVIVVASVSAVVFDVPAAVVLEGAKRGAFFLTLFVAIGLLQDAAALSPMMRTCGEYLVNQPPSRRYLMLSFGSHLCSLGMYQKLLRTWWNKPRFCNIGSTAAGEEIAPSMNPETPARHNSRAGLLAARAACVHVTGRRKLEETVLWQMLAVDDVVTDRA